MKSRERVNSRRRSASGVATRSVSSEISTAALAVTGASGLAIGLMSLAALVGGLVAAGGPLNLAASYFSAVTGV